MAENDKEIQLWVTVNGSPTTWYQPEQCAQAVKKAQSVDMINRHFKDTDKEDYGCISKHVRPNLEYCIQALSVVTTSQKR